MSENQKTFKYIPHNSQDGKEALAQVKPGCIGVFRNNPGERNKKELIKRMPDFLGVLAISKFKVQELLSYVNAKSSGA